MKVSLTSLFQLLTLFILSKYSIEFFSIYLTSFFQQFIKYFSIFPCFISLPPFNLGYIFTYFIPNSLCFFMEISFPTISLNVNWFYLGCGIMSLIQLSSSMCYWYVYPFVFIVMYYMLEFFYCYFSNLVFFLVLYL